MMKTSKILFTSLLAAAAMSTVPVWATDYTVTGAVTGGGTTGKTADLTGTINGKSQTISVAGSDTLTFESVSGYLPGWNNGTCAGNIILSADAGSTSAFVWNNGSSKSVTTITFSGSLSGSGTFEKNTSKNDKKQCFVFAGDVSGFSGNFKLATEEANNTGTLTFGNGGAAVTGTYDDSSTAKSVSGTGEIIWAGQSVVFNYDNTNPATVGNSSITAKTLEFKGGADYTVSSAVTGSNSTASNNTLTLSAGTTTFTGTVSGFGNITVASGATLAVGTGVALDLSGATVTLASAISNSGTVTVNSSTVFALADAMESDGIYTVISGSGTVSGGSLLSLSNFRHEDGSVFAGRSTIDVATSGVVKITEVAANLVWSGSTSGTWDVQTTKNWQNNGTDDEFYIGDSVTFNSNATVAVASGVKAGTLTVSEGATLTLSGGTVSATSLSGTGTVSLGGDAGLSLTSKLATKADFSKVSGTGTITVIGGTGDGKGVTLGDDFTGTLYVTKDSKDSRLLLSDSSLGGAKILVGNNAQLVFNGTGTNVSNDVTFEGNSTIYANSNCNGTLSGNITSTGTLTKAGGGTLNLSGAGTSISDLRVSVGSVNITAGEATIKGSGSLVGNLTIGGSATVYVGQTDSLSYSASNTITVNSGGMLDLGKCRWTVGANNKIVLAGGTIKGTGDNNGALDFYVSGTVTAKANTESEISATVRLRKDDKTTATETFSTETGAKLLISGKVTDGGAMIKSGEGTLTLTGTNTYTGGTTISVGTLVAGSASALGTGKVTVASGAKLGLVAGTTVTANGGVELANGAKIVVDMTGVSEAETFTLDLLTTSALSYNGDSITSTNVGTLLTDGVVTLSNWVDKDGWTQSLALVSGSDTNTLTLTMTIPEPSTFGLLAGVGALALVVARRRRRAK